jgi:predicted DNA-binding transcriptional regulator AlpA
MEQSKPQEPPRFRSLPEVSQIVQLGESTILAWEATGKFPRAIRLSKTRRVWLEQDIHAWMMALHARREVA